METKRRYLRFLLSKKYVLDLDNVADISWSHWLLFFCFRLQIAPSGVIIYEATDDTLREKVKQKHAEDEGAEHSEDPVERFERRLKTYRFYNGPDRIKSVDYFFQQQVKVQPLPREVGDHISE